MNAEELIEQLPSLPAALTKLINLDINDDAYFDKVLELSESDPTFAVRLINVANAAASAPVSQIVTLSHAISRIGARQVYGLMMSYVMSKVFTPTQSDGDIWQHAIQVALTAETIARLSVHHGIEPEQAYLCGLLHDIGRFILLRNNVDERLLMDEKEYEKVDHLTDLEHEICGYTHAALGEYACRAWSMPDMVTKVVAYHHHYNERSGLTQKEIAMVNMVQMADFFSLLIIGNPESEAWSDAEFMAVFTEQCPRAFWQDLSLDPLLLHNETQNIVEMSNNILVNLGLSHSDN